MLFRKGLRKTKNFKVFILILEQFLIKLQSLILKITGYTRGKCLEIIKKNMHIIAQ